MIAELRGPAPRRVEVGDVAGEPAPFVTVERAVDDAFEVETFLLDDPTGEFPIYTPIPGSRRTLRP